MKSFLIVLFTIQSVLLFGQGKISGLIVEKSSQTPIEFAGIEIYGKENGNNELQLNYSLRINRPAGDDLNPFPEYKDPMNVKSGNPYLKPEKIHSIEFGYMLRQKSTTYIATLYYHNIFNRMTEVSRFINDL